MMNYRKIKFALTTVLVLLLISGGEALAQCAMCRSTLENGFSNGNPGMAAGINTGILYLLSIPYLAIMTLGYFWYKSAKHGDKGISGGVAKV